MEGPDRPRCVKRKPSSNAIRPQPTRAATDTPARSRNVASSCSAKVSGTSAGRVSVTPRPNCSAIRQASPVAPILGIDLPPVARTSRAARTGPRAVWITKSPSRSTDSMAVDSHSSTPASAICPVSIATICLALPSQKSWPRVFSCQAIPARSTRAMKAEGGKRRRAEIAKRGLADRNRSCGASRLVKLHRPPPEMRIFSPGAALWSMTRTERPRRPASTAHIMPAAPAPRIATSTRFIPPD